MDVDMGMGMAWHVHVVCTTCILQCCDPFHGTRTHEARKTMHHGGVSASYRLCAAPGCDSTRRTNYR